LSFADEVAAYRLEELPLELPPQLGQPALLVVGEPHGAEQTASVVWTLMRRLRLDRLALEWPEDELAPIGCDPARLDELPPDAETLSGEGRFSAGLFALVAALPKPPFLLDRHGDPGIDRSAFLLGRLRELVEPGARTLALIGALHAARMHEARLDAVVLDYAGGAVRHHGVHELEPLPPELTLPRVALGPARAAAVARV
jgi:hypothetical protein